MALTQQDVLPSLLELLALDGGSRREQQVVDYLRGQALDAGVASGQIKIDSAHKRAGGETGNLVITLPARGMRSPRRLLMAHMDTVPLCKGAVPVQKGEYLVPKSAKTALGGDDRSGCAVLLNTLKTLLTSDQPHPPLTFLWTVQEEIGLVGARHVTKSLLKSPQLCFNFDGGDPLTLVNGATGDVHFEIIIHGIASHAGVHPELGVNAMTIASVAIADLESRGWLGLVEQGRKKGTSNLGIIQGGEATNVVLEQLKIVGEARSHDAKFRERILKEIEKAFRTAVKTVKNALGHQGSYEMTSRLKYEAFRLEKGEPVVQSAMKAVESVGGTPTLKVSNGGLDANWTTAQGFPTITIGCGQQGIHTVEERLHLPSFLQACEIALQLATGV